MLLEGVEQNLLVEFNNVERCWMEIMHPFGRDPIQFDEPDKKTNFSCSGDLNVDQAIEVQLNIQVFEGAVFWISLKSTLEGRCYFSTDPEN